MLTLVTPNRPPAELLVVHALGAAQLAARGVDAGDLFLGHRAGAVHHQRETGQPLLDFGHHVEVEALRAAELERAVAGADGDASESQPERVTKSLAW